MNKIIKDYGKDSKNLPNLRFVAMCGLGVFGFLRFSEIAKLKRSDTRFTESHIELFIEKSKTDKYRGAKVYVSFSENKDSQTCLISYLNLA